MVALACIATACYNDMGSYDYKDVNEIQMGGLGEVHNVIFKKDTLRIQPELSFTQDGDTPDRYEYEWKAVPYANTNAGVVIGTERNLNYFMELNPASYALYLKVKDKDMGLLWTGQTRIEVRTETGRGFLLIGEDAEGYVNVDMISMPNDTIVLKNLLTNNGLPRLRGARSICHTGSASSADFIKLWVMTDDRSYYVNTSTFEAYPTNTFERLVYTNMEMPEELNPVYIFSKQNYPQGNSFTRRLVACDNGYIFKISLGTEECYPNPLNRTSAEPNKLFRAYPYVFSALDLFFGGAMYDMDNNRFLSFGQNDATCKELADKVGDVFPWKQPEGRVLCHAENTTGGSFTLMKDMGTNQFHIYKFRAGMFTSKLGYYPIKRSLAPNLDKAELFAFSSKRTMFFYAVGKVLYAYDYNKGNERPYEMTLDGDITMLKFDIQSTWDYTGLYIATDNGEGGGTLQKYVLGSDSNVFGLVPDEHCRWTGLVKVKDMDWRNSTL